MLTGELVLSCCGAALGVLLAVAGTRALAHLDSISIPLLPTCAPMARRWLFTLLMAVLTGLVFGLAPALQVRATALHDA